MSSERTLKREVDSLIECAGELRCNRLFIVTMNEERVIEMDEYHIEVVPVHKFQWICASLSFFDYQNDNETPFLSFIEDKT